MEYRGSPIPDVRMLGYSEILNVEVRLESLTESQMYHFEYLPSATLRAFLSRAEQKLPFR